MPDPIPDEQGRVSGVDYSSQSWTIEGLPTVTTLEEAMVLVESTEATQEEPTS